MTKKRYYLQCFSIRVLYPPLNKTVIYELPVLIKKSFYSHYIFLSIHFILALLKKIGSIHLFLLVLQNVNKNKTSCVQCLVRNVFNFKSVCIARKSSYLKIIKKKDKHNACTLMHTYEFYV